MKTAAARLGVAVTSLAITLTAVAATELRLAGTITRGQGEWLALVELPSGSQQLVRVGDKVGDGVIASIGDRIVRVRYATADTVYVLDGGKTIAAWESAPSLVASTAPLVVPSRESSADLPARLRGLETRYAKDAATLNTELNRALGLPVGTRIERVNHFTVASDLAASKRIRSELAGRRITHLFLANSKELTEVYVMPPGMKPPMAPGTLP